MPCGKCALSVRTISIHAPSHGRTRTQTQYTTGSLGSAYFSIFTPFIEWGWGARGARHRSRCRSRHPPGVCSRLRGGLSNHTGWVLASACVQHTLALLRARQSQSHVLAFGGISELSVPIEIFTFCVCVVVNRSFPPRVRSSSDRFRVGTAWHWGLGCRQSGTQCASRARACAAQRCVLPTACHHYFYFPSPLFRCLRAYAPRILALCSGRRARPSRVVRSTVMCMGGLRLAPRAGQPQRIEDERTTSLRES